MKSSRLMQKYKDESFITQLKVRFLFRVHYAFFILFPVIIIYSVYVQLILTGSFQKSLAVLLPQVAGIIIMAGIFYLLIQGHNVLSAHLTITLLLSVFWLILFFEDSNPITRLDTIIYLAAILSMTPLIVSRKRIAIPIYQACNLLVFYLFIYFSRDQINIAEDVLAGYVADNTVAILIVGLIAYQLFSILDNALNKIEQDITEREIAEKSATESRSFLETSFASSPTGIILTNPSMTISYVNPAALSWTDFEAADIIGKSLEAVFASFVRAESYPDVEKLIRTRLKSGEQTISRNLSVTGKDGKPVELSLSVANNYDHEGRVQGGIIFVSNITDQVRMEEMMIQSEKMISVGGLAAGMAHEINNPLAAIIQNNHLLKTRLTENSRKNRQTAGDCGTTSEAIQAYADNRGIVKSIDAITQSVQRASQIVTNMLSFSRKSHSKKMRQDLGQLANMTLDLASKSYDLAKGYDFRNISVERDYESPMPRVICEAGEIQQVMLNILTNGSQAMLETPKADEKPQFTIRIRREPDMVRLEIEDNGPGIDAETRKRIFEPFFTTKKKGVGTGLGLSISYFIITENHKGTIAVESEPGMGAKFIIRLPADQGNR